MSKTLLFTTCYSKDLSGLEKRPLKWLKYHSSCGLNFDKILILDDGSPELPSWEGVEIITEDIINEPTSKVVFFNLKPHLGRCLKTNHDYPGWYRSFCFAAQYSKKFNYDKVIHVESDAFLVSDKIINHFNNLNSGWHSMWCPRHGFPETAIQVICKDSLDKYNHMTSINYNTYKGHAIELFVPFTNVEKSFIGDRYGEYMDKPPSNCDYICQFHDDWEVKS